jgi:hypothetical protein
MPFLGERHNGTTQQAQHTAAAVFVDTWTDPEDDKPTAAKTARHVSGFRAYCPLRRCIARHGERAGYTVEHLEAADRLRAAYAGARLGFAGLKD